MRFHDRRDAGEQLARQLGACAREHPVVLALPRGGVPVGLEVARSLGAPLDVLVVRKLGAPMQPELGVGAVAEGGVRYVDETLCAALGISSETLAAIVSRQTAEVSQRVSRYRSGRPPVEVRDRTVILVDDGVATGGTARAAIRALRALGPRRIVFAAPVAAAQAVAALRDEVDELVVLQAPQDLMAIGYWYQDFGQVSDREVTRTLSLAAAGETPAPGPVP